MVEPRSPGGMSRGPKYGDRRPQYGELNACLIILGIYRLAISCGAYQPATILRLEKRAVELLGQVVTHCPRIQKCAKVTAARFRRSNIETNDLIDRVFEQINCDIRQKRLRFMVTPSYLCTLIENAATTIRRGEYPHQERRSNKSADDIDPADARTAALDHDRFATYNNEIMNSFDAFDRKIIDAAISALFCKSELNWLLEIGRLHGVSRTYVKKVLLKLADDLASTFELDNKETAWLVALLSYGDRSRGWRGRLAKKVKIAPSGITRRNQDLLARFERRLKLNLKQLKQPNTNGKKRASKRTRKKRSSIRLTPREFYRLLRWVSRDDAELCSFFSLIEKGIADESLRQQLGLSQTDFEKLVRRAGKHIHMIQSWEKRGVEQYHCLRKRGLNSKILTALAAVPRQLAIVDRIVVCAASKPRIPFVDLALELGIRQFALLRTLNLLADLESAMTTLTTKGRADLRFDAACRCMTSHGLLPRPPDAGHLRVQNRKLYSVLAWLKKLVCANQTKIIHKM